MEIKPLSWVDKPLNHFTNETPTRGDLKQAIALITRKSKNKLKNKPATQEHLQTVVDFVVSHLVAESSINSVVPMKYEYARQLSYNDCEGDVFLPPNFNNSSGGKADAVLLVVLPNQNKMKFPILVGELKTKVDIRGTKSDYVHLFNYMLTVQRPYRVNETRSQLIGFLMDFDEAYIFRLTVGFWTDDYIVPSIAQFMFITITYHSSSTVPSLINVY